MRVLVIGAGPAGLAAAWRLSESGAEVVVLEGGAVPGGMLAGSVRGGLVADVGVQLVASAYTATFGLARALGAGELLERAAGRDAVWRKGRAHELTYGSAASMAASGALPGLLKVKLAGKYVPWLKTRGSHLDASDLAGTAAAQDGESIAAWGERELGRDFVEYLAYPQLAAYFGMPPEAASAGFYHALARVGLHVSVHAPRGGAAAFAAALAAGLERRGVRLEYGARVGRVLDGAAEAGLLVDGRELAAAGVVVATPPAEAAALVGGAAAEWLGGVRTRPAVSVVLWLRRRVPVEWFGLSFPRLEPPGDVVAAVCVQSRKLDYGGRPGDALVAFPAPAFLDTGPDDAALADALTQALELPLPGLARVLEAVEVHRFEGGYRAFPAGTIRRLAEAPPPAGARVVLAGDYLVAPSVEGAVRSGIAAAERLLALP